MLQESLNEVTAFGDFGDFCAFGEAFFGEAFFGEALFGEVTTFGEVTAFGEALFGEALFGETTKRLAFTNQ